MGYEVARFQNNSVDEELLCPICSVVLEDPVQGNNCEHAFCRACIREWLRQQCTCPVDRKELTVSDLRPVPRILRNMLARLTIKCDNAENGCPQWVKLDHLQAHVQDCVYNPKRLLPCSKGCGTVLQSDEMNDHNCLKELRSLINKQDKRINNMKHELAEYEQTISEMKIELQHYKDMFHAIQAVSPRARIVTEQIERSEMIRWSQTLSRARVLRWGGMISTPDESLQQVIHRALSDFGCPPNILEALIQNCHERRWPRGLNSLETRQYNRQAFENYVCRRVPLNQAIVILACDNDHMPSELIMEPGMIMIFAHGIVDM